MDTPTLSWEQGYLARGHSYLIGCDEVGRGCLAGPVVAAAVLLRWDEEALVAREAWRAFVRDSKQLSRKRRIESDEFLRAHVLSFGIGEVDVGTIDSVNILQASLLAMRMAIESMDVPDGTHVLVDGNVKIPELKLNQQTIIGGDAKVFSIAAASIIAKEYRDRLMEKMHEQYPNYGFSAHKGYATEMHRDAILAHGMTPEHRRTFCRNIVASISTPSGV